MKINRQIIERIIFRQYKEAPRFTQDSPVYPDVWLVYFKHIGSLATYQQDLILTPHFRSNAGELFKAVNETLDKTSSPAGEDWQLASNGEAVAACLTFFELIKLIVPFSSWWQRTYKKDEETENWQWLETLVGAFLYAADHPKEIIKDNSIIEIDERAENKLHDKFIAHFKSKMQEFKVPEKNEHGILYSVSRNRPATLSIQKSVGTTKADAGRRLFDVDGTDIVWAILDTGIDATNNVFRKKDPDTGEPYKEAFGSTHEPGSNFTRIIATYDFTRFREVLNQIHESRKPDTKTRGSKYVANKGMLKDRPLLTREVKDYEKDIKKALKSGRALDWSLIAHCCAYRTPIRDTMRPNIRMVRM